MWLRHLLHACFELKMNEFLKTLFQTLRLTFNSTPEQNQCILCCFVMLCIFRLYLNILLDLQHKVITSNLPQSCICHGSHPLSLLKQKIKTLLNAINPAMTRATTESFPANIENAEYSGAIHCR